MREILNLAEKAIVNEKLGQRDEPDLIFIGLSAMDWIIHDYGPFSQEVMDAFVKLDKYLMNFIKNVDNILGLENVLFTLTADHGGLPLPEYIVKNGGSGGRIKKDHLKEALQWIDQESEELYGNNLYHRDESNFYLNYKSLKDKNVDTVELFKIVEKYLLRVEGVEKVIKKDNILKSEYNNDKIKTRIKNMIHHDYSPDFFPNFKKGYLFRSPYGTSHGTPYDYDTHVPLIFSRKEFEKKLIDLKKETVDIAPSIAKYLGVKIPNYAMEPIIF